MAEHEAPGNWRLIRRLASHAMALRFALLLSLFGFSMYALGMVLLADLLQFLLDVVDGETSGSLLQAGVNAIAGEDLAARIAIPLALVFLTLLRAFGLFFGAFPLDVVARRLVHNLRAALFRQLSLVPLSRLEQDDSGAALSRMTYVTEQVSAAITDVVKTVLREGLLLAGLLAYMAYLNWRLTLVVLLVAPLIAFTVRWVGFRFRRYSEGVQASMANMTQQTGDALRGQREIRTFNAVEFFRARFAAANRDNLHQSVRFSLAQALSTPAVQLLLSLGLALMLWFALGAGLLGGFSAGALAAYLTAAVQIGKPVRQLSAVQGAVQRALAAAQDVFAQLDDPTEEDEGTHTVKRAKGDLRFENVSFTYPGAQHPALSGVTFSVPAGATVGIVGRSGSGKSTLVDLLLRFIEPQSGSVHLDGIDLPSYELHSLREQFSLVSQSAPLFADTIYNNIAMSAPGRYADSEVEAAAQMAHALQFVSMLPLGLQTHLRNNGESLSGGERQRIALARALLKDAPVLVVDEGTAHLDAETESRFQAALAEHARGRTTIIIAHRLSTLQGADFVLVLEGGCLVEQGAHAELLAQSTRYRSLSQGELASS